MRAALRHLCEKGVEALKPQKVLSKLAQQGFNTRNPEVWRRPVVSKRVGNVLRKKSIQDGTYGSFDATTGTGWDPQWDLTLNRHQFSAQRFGGIQRGKGTKRQRTREERAKKIEAHLETRLEKMEEYYVEKESFRVKEQGFEAYYKRLMKKGGGP